MKLLEVERKNFPQSIFRDLYYHFLKCTWSKLFLFYVVFFLGLNFVFGLFYYMNTDSLSKAISFPEAFFFSVHTFTTIGYGNISPVGAIANILVTIQIMVGVLSTALITGLVFSKFSLPSARVLFTNNILITSFYNKKTLLFRLANGRANQIIGANIHLSITLNDQTPEGHKIRRFYPLTLVRSQAPIFALSWMVMHEVDDKSPIFNMSKSDLEASDANFLVTISGVDSTNGQTIHSINRYSSSELIEDKMFKDVLITDDNGKQVLDYAHFHDFN